MKKKKGFTFIELIISITILAILGTLGFIAYNGHIISSRDAIRRSELSDVYSLFELHKNKGTLPIPDKRIEVYSSGVLIGYQGFLSKDIHLNIGFKGTGKDPLDNTYYLTKDLRNPGVMGFLETNPNKLSYLDGLIPKVNALDYTNRYPIVFGKKLGIILDDENLPIQENISLQKVGNLELNTLTSNYVAYFDDKTSIDNTNFSLDILYGTSVTGIIGNSCEQYKEESNGKPLRPGLYLINSSTGIYEKFCDMINP